MVSRVKVPHELLGNGNHFPILNPPAIFTRARNKAKRIKGGGGRELNGSARWHARFPIVCSTILKQRFVTNLRWVSLTFILLARIPIYILRLKRPINSYSLLLATRLVEQTLI